MSDKWPKDAALYVYKKGKQYRCDECFAWKNKKCSLYGEYDHILDHAKCDYWIEKPYDDFEMPFLGNVTKGESGYTEDKGTCKNCEHFIEPNDCTEVDKDSPGYTPGIIDPMACCCNFKLKKQ